MSNILSPYFSPWHYYPQDEDYLRRLDPAWVRIHQPTAKAIELVQRVAPNARILLRSWDIDDHNGDRKKEMYADPRGAARRHLEMWRAKWEELTAELHRNGWPVKSDRWYLGLINEPDPAFVSQMVEYTLEAMDLVKGTMIRLGVVCSSVGTFSKPSENNHGWTLCKPLEKPINDGGHILVVHEYWQPEGPNYGEDAGNLAWRHHSIPLDVPILIGESGANGYIYQRHSANDDAGWRKFMSPEQYAAQVKEYIEGCDQRVKGVCLYMLDYHSAQWESFHTGPAAEQLLTIKDTRPQVNHTVYVPIVTTPPVAQPPTAPRLVHPIENPALRRITQRFGERPEAYAQFGLRGHNGLDFGTPTGTPIRAVDDGVVAERGDEGNRGYGIYLKLVHPWGDSLYAHLSSTGGIRQGDSVKAGQPIGLSGNTGNSTGAHLHYAMRVHPYDRGDGWNGFTDPLPYITDVSLPTPVVPTDDIQLMARIITAEARGEPIEGQLAVAHAIKNRLLKPERFGDTLYRIMTKPAQFAPPADVATETAKAVATLAIAGLTLDPVDGANHFHADYASPYWAPSMTFIRQIGGHIFLRD